MEDERRQERVLVQCRCDYILSEDMATGRSYAIKTRLIQAAWEKVKVRIIYPPNHLVDKFELARLLELAVLWRWTL